MKHIDLFSGIGGFALAVDTVWPNSEHIFCDNDLFCQQVLKKHWPNSKIYGDIREIATDPYCDGRTRGGETFDSDRIWQQTFGDTKTSNQHERTILTGGFPCQPFSQAGRRQGTSDDRYLWPEMFRVIREFKPTWVIAENVRGLVTWNEGLVLEQVCADLESEGYEVQPLIIPAVSVNAPHRRDRIWFIAHRTGEGLEGGARESIQGNSQRLAVSYATDSRRFRQTEQQQQTAGDEQYSWNDNWVEVAAELCRVDARVSTWVDGRGKVRNSRNERLRALGNSIVPAVAIEILRAIKNQ